MRHFKTLALHSSATLALLSALSFTAQAQVSVTEDTTEQILTSTAGEDGTADDVTVDVEATVTVDAARAGLVLDSDNALALEGNVRAEDINGATGVLIQGGNEGSYTQTGSISIVEDFTPENTDDDIFVDGGFAEGSGRTGILISGASPFRGNIELASTSSVLVEGNDSFGINLANTPLMTEGLTGNLTTAGQVSVVGDRSVGVNLASSITGDVTHEGAVSVRGTDSDAYVVSGDINGGFVSNGAISSSGFRFTTRLGFGGEQSDAGREDLSAEDLQQSGSALTVSGNVSQGVFLNQAFVEAIGTDGEVLTDEEGNPLFVLSSQSTITQLGSAPAVLIGGDGAPIAIGLVAQVTDPLDENFDSSLQYGFINQGTVTANGIFDDVNATTVALSNATFEGGISNTGTLTATTFRGATPTDLSDGDGVARVLVLGDQAIADEINNSGAIVATVNEATDEIFFDRTNVIAPRDLLAVAVDVGVGASAGELINSGVISAVLVGREGTAIAVRDATGTIRRLENSGNITARGLTSDSLGLEDTEFDLIAIDFSAATDDIEINQFQNDSATNTPLILGNILLGSGNDTLTVSDGIVGGDIDFGGGNDALSLSGGSTFIGAIRNTDSLALSVTEGSNLSIQSTDDIQVSEARFESGSVFRPTINGATGQATTLVSAGDITFEAGTTINPFLETVIGTDTFRYTIASAENLTVDDLAGLGSGESPFLFNTSLSLADANTLVVTLDMRDPTASLEDGGLGLDAVQLAAFGTVVDGEFQNGAVIDALSSVSSLSNAFSNISEADDFYAAFNQILPEFSGAAKQFVLANVDGAVGAVGSHLDAARRSPDKSGGAWLQEYFYFADRELAGLSEQFRGEGFGFAGGLDSSIGPFHAVGVSAGFASTEVEDVVGIDEPLDVRTYQLGTYAGFESNGFSIDVYGGGGISEFEQNRRVSIGNFQGAAEGEWDGVHANASLRAGYETAISDKYWVRPSLSLDYLYLNEDGHTETGSDGVRLEVSERKTDTAAASAMLNFGANFQGKRTWIRPSIRVGYRNEFISDPVETEFRFQGLTDTDGGVFDSELARLRAFAFPDEGLLLGFTLAAGSQYSSFGFDFDSDIRDGFVRHTGRIVVRLLF